MFWGGFFYADDISYFFSFSETTSFFPHCCGKMWLVGMLPAYSFATPKMEFV
jgi:hypothetical protein